MFEYKPGAMIELADLVDKTFSEAIVYPSEKWKSVNNALYLVNKRVIDKIGEGIFRLGKTRFSRIK